MIGPECASGHRKLLFLYRCCRDLYPPFQLAPQFTFEQHIKGKQRSVCARVCVCVCEDTHSDKLLKQSVTVMSSSYIYRLLDLQSKVCSKTSS